MRVAIVKYNAGNTASVVNAMRRLGVEPVVTDEPETLRSVDKVIFPGVGEASSAMHYLRQRALDSVIVSLTQPVLGICLGMQLMCRSSEENETPCLNIMPYRVRRFVSETLKIPHTGWNRISELASPLFDGVADDSRVYFVHEFYVESGDDTTAVTEYGQNFSAAVGVRNVHAVQFHPEKSGAVGERILENFLKI